MHVLDALLIDELLSFSVVIIMQKPSINPRVEVRIENIVLDSLGHQEQFRHCYGVVHIQTVLRHLA